MVSDAMETANWVNGLCRDHMCLVMAVKIILTIMALFGSTTMWFAAVLDGAAVLATLLLSIRAFGFDQPHRRLWDLFQPRNKA